MAVKKLVNCEEVSREMAKTGRRENNEEAKVGSREEEEQTTKSSFGQRGPGSQAFTPSVNRSAHV